MSKHYSYLITAAITEAVFIGFFIKTGIDASPISLAKKIIEILEPLNSNNNIMIQTGFIKFMLDILSFVLFIPIIIGIIKVGWKKGLAIFFGIFISVILLIMYH